MLAWRQYSMWGAVGVAGTFYFGVRSLLQSEELESLRIALRAYNQGLYNNLWRMGGHAEEALKVKTFEEAKLLSQGIADMSQTARHTLVAFGEEHALKKPYYEPAWNPVPLPPAKKSFYKRFFGL
jgi:hypothetical protein